MTFTGFLHYNISVQVQKNPGMADVTGIKNGNNNIAAKKQLTALNQNATAATAGSAVKTNVPASVQQGSASRTMPALIAAAGLPADRFSAAVLSFARFFSLPFKPELMAELRRQALAPATAQALPGGGVPPGGGAALAEQANAAKTALAKSAETIVKNREALTLAAAAAESKGVELTPKGLTMLAEAVDPDWQRRHGSDERNRDRKQRKEQNDQTKERITEKSGVITGSELREMILGSAAKDPLLTLLNRLPGKNGQRWMVLPFEFSHDSRDFNVTLRILIEGKSQRGSMVIDIVENGTTDRRWLFAAESAGYSLRRLAVFIQPELPLSQHKPFIDELSRHIGIPSGHIVVNSFICPFPCESDSAAESAAIFAADTASDLLRSIDEAV